MLNADKHNVDLEWRTVQPNRMGSLDFKFRSICFREEDTRLLTMFRKQKEEEEGEEGGAGNLCGTQ